MVEHLEMSLSNISKGALTFFFIDSRDKVNSPFNNLVTAFSLAL